MQRGQFISSYLQKRDEVKEGEIKKSHKLLETMNRNAPENWPDKKSLTNVSRMIALPVVGEKKKKSLPYGDFSHIVHF